MADFPESKPCVECSGTMDRRHGTLPVRRPAGAAELRGVPAVASTEVGTYYRCLNNGAHTIIVARDAALPSSGRH